MQEIHSEHTFNEKKYLMMISDSIPSHASGCDLCVFKQNAIACNLAYNSCKNNDYSYFVEKPKQVVENKGNTMENKSALATQAGGNHYKIMGIQPVEYIQANNLDYFEGNVVKYVTRHKNKGKEQDIKKAIHYLQLILELQYKETKGD